jgi:hypothetical protein
VNGHRAWHGQPCQSFKALHCRRATPTMQFMLELSIDRLLRPRHRVATLAPCPIRAPLCGDPGAQQCASAGRKRPMLSAARGEVTAAPPQPAPPVPSSKRHAAGSCAHRPMPTRLATGNPPNCGPHGSTSRAAGRRVLRRRDPPATPVAAGPRAPGRARRPPPRSEFAAPATSWSLAAD